jgi:methyltransferase family protein/putative zinc binding protein/C-methyltransferase-like protein
VESGLHQIERCEVCGNEDLASVLDLGLHPLCDDLVPLGESRQCREYPIEILFCRNCNTAHQRFQVPQRELFPASYHYRARFTADVLLGMAGLADSCERKLGGLAGKTVLDIGCNDGSLLDFFREKGALTVGLEPTEAFRNAEQKGHATFNEFLSEEVAKEIVAAHGKPDVITFTNVFAHIEHLDKVILALKRLMAGHTVIVIENHYLGSVLEGNQFDTFYHEHCRTYSYTSFVHIAQSLGVRLLKVEFPSRYGGNIRVFLGTIPIPDDDGIDRNALAVREEEFFQKFVGMRSNVERWRAEKGCLIREHVRRCGKLRAKAFPARATILIKLLGLNEDSIAAVYEKPGSLKIGHCVPGTRIPIRSDDELFALSDKTQPLLNLAWHIPDEIRSYLTKHGYTGPVMDILSAKNFESEGFK